MSLYGLLAHPAGHSLSPIMQNKLMRENHINGYYHIFDVKPENLISSVNGIRALNIDGFNVSTPFKESIIDLIDELTPLSNHLHTVNTVKNINGKLIGTTTDGDGFWQSINPNQPHENVVILGSGGSAKAVIATAHQYGVRNLSVYNRSHSDWSQRETMISYLSHGIGQLFDLSDNQHMSYALSNADLLINATTVGMNDSRMLLNDYQINLLPQHALVVDMIYRNKQTGLLRTAQRRHLATQNGIPMLVSQGALSFEYWFKQPANRQMMLEAIQGE